MADRFDDHYTEYQAHRSSARKFVRRAYLASARRKLSGKVLDFGCGIGELLATLPVGSMGLEYNQATVAYCRSRGLDVEWYDGTADDWCLSVVPRGRQFDSMILSHVLEHLDEPAEVLQKLLVAGRKLGVRRVLAVVPGRAGFRIDPTHLTFIDRPFLSDPVIVKDTGFSLVASNYFPGNIRVLGNWFPHHELQALFALDVARAS